MTDESPSPSPDETPAPSDKPTGRSAKVRRISNPRPGKSAPREITIPIIPETVPSAADGEAAEPSPGNSDWPSAPDEISREESSHNKRGNNRRRKKGKGGHSSSQTSSQDEEAMPEHDSESENAEPAPPSESTDSAETPETNPPAPPAQTSHSPRPPREDRDRDRERDRDRDRERDRDRQSPPPNRPRHDPETIGKCAWKIYLAEISEEGVALVSDHDARELARRCFRLAEIFLDEQARRR